MIQITSSFLTNIFKKNETKEMTLEKIKTVTFLYMMNIITHLESVKFIKFLDTGLDFFLNHYLFCMHIWLLIQRMSNFSVRLCLFSKTSLPVN